MQLLCGRTPKPLIWPMSKCWMPSAEMLLKKSEARVRLLAVCGGYALCVRLMVCRAVNSAVCRLGSAVSVARAPPKANCTGAEPPVVADIVLTLCLIVPQDVNDINMDHYMVEAVNVYGDFMLAMYYGNETGSWHIVHRVGSEVRSPADGFRRLGCHPLTTTWSCSCVLVSVMEAPGACRYTTCKTGSAGRC